MANLLEIQLEGYGSCLISEEILHVLFTLKWFSDSEKSICVLLTKVLVNKPDIFHAGMVFISS